VIVVIIGTLIALHEGTVKAQQRLIHVIERMHSFEALARKTVPRIVDH